MSKRTQKYLLNHTQHRLSPGWAFLIMLILIILGFIFGPDNYRIWLTQ